MAVIDWLRPGRESPSVTIAGRQLPLAIRHHARARRLTMRLAPDGSEVRVTLPKWGRTQDALVFAASRTAWLEQQLAAVPDALRVGAGGTVRLRGMAMAVEWSPESPRQPRARDGAIRLGGAHETVNRRLQRWLQVEALRLLGEDLCNYCARAGLPVPQLRLSRAQRRWGSCSGQGAIRINWRLIQAPDFVRRSVVAHEVAHLVHFNHSAAFHQLLASLYEGDVAEADAWLRREGRGLYAAFG